MYHFRDSGSGGFEFWKSVTTVRVLEVAHIFVRFRNSVSFVTETHSEVSTKYIPES